MGKNPVPLFLRCQGSRTAPRGWMLATTGLSTPLGFIASPLHRVVRNSSSLNQSPGYSLPES
jgi:hypothetical protein